MLLRLLFLFLIAYILISVVKAYLTRIKSSTDGSDDQATVGEKKVSWTRGQPGVCVMP